MLSFTRRGLPLLFVFAAILLVSCSAGEITPEPTVTKTPRIKTAVVVDATPTATPSQTPTTLPATPTATKPTPRVAGMQIPQPPSRDPLLPIFGPFPPVPIPNRPANINPLTGLGANPSALQRRPILVRIGNDEKVRANAWQAGLNAADLVVEELIDQLGSAYAHTRYTAVFLSNDPPLIGPVRSGRLINLQIAPMLDGALVHAGASNGTRWLFSQTPMINLDEFFNQPAYCYITSHGYQGRLYTTGPRLRQWLEKKGWEKPIPLFGFAFSDGPPSGQPITTIGLIRSPWPKWAQVEWRYDAGSGKYLRFVTGAPQIETDYPVTAKWGNGADCIPSGGETRSQVRATNVIVLYAKHEKTNIVEDSNNAVSVHIYLTGQGDAQIFRDGVMIRGKWHRQSEQEFFEFVDASGAQITLKPGNTWFEIVPTGYTLDLK